MFVRGRVCQCVSVLKFMIFARHVCRFWTHEAVTMRKMFTFRLFLAAIGFAVFTLVALFTKILVYSSERLYSDTSWHIFDAERGKFAAKIEENTFKLPMRSEMSGVHKEGWTNDYLPPACRRRKYGSLSGWPKVSVVVAFCQNELFTDILHTIHSIIQRSPNILLEEIILVDDNTEKEFGDALRIYCSAVFRHKNIRIIRSEVSLGLIKARLLGTRAAVGDVIVSMDAHMEVQEMWLEALLWEIIQNRKSLATAELDWMIYSSEKGWTYRTGYNSFVCIFGWSLGFGFGFSRPEIEAAWKKDNTMAIPAPCTVGTIWAMDRKYFIEIGELDEGMEMWGGENIDLAIRTWLFGGRVVQIPCSHAAHLERPRQRDYRLGWGKYTDRNNRRMIDVWFDEYKKYVFMENPQLETIDPGNITSRLVLKQKAVYNFTWFLDNVFPELGIYDRDSIGYGSLRNLGCDTCVHRIGSQPLTLWKCMEEQNKEGLFLTTDGYLRTDLQAWHAQGKDVGSRIGPEGATGTYHEKWLSQWIHWKDGPMFLYEADGRGTVKTLCLEGFLNRSISLEICNSNNTNQLWQWKVYSSNYDDVMKNKYRTNYHQELLSIKQNWYKLYHGLQFRLGRTTTVIRGKS